MKATTTTQPVSDATAKGTEPQPQPVDTFDAAWHMLRNADTQADKLDALEHMARLAKSTVQAETVAEQTAIQLRAVDRFAVTTTLRIRRMDGQLLQSLMLAGGKSLADWEAASIGKLLGYLPDGMLGKSRTYWSLANRALRFTTPDTVHDAELAREAVDVAADDDAKRAAMAAAPTSVTNADILTSWAEARILAARGEKSGSNRGGGSATMAEADDKAKAAEARRKADKAEADAIVAVIRDASDDKIKPTVTVGEVTATSAVTVKAAAAMSDAVLLATIAHLRGEQRKRAEAKAKAKAEADAAAKVVAATAKADAIMAKAEAAADKVKAAAAS